MATKQNVETSKEQLNAKSAPKQTADKYEQAMKKYDTSLNSDEVRETVRNLIEEKVHTDGTPEMGKFLFGDIELISLKCTDLDENIIAFTEEANQFDTQYADLPHVTTICVCPCFAQMARNTSEIEGAEIACVSGSFSSSQALIEIKVTETALAVKDGATEIGIMMPVGKFLDDSCEEMCEDIRGSKKTCGGTAMKAILETGYLEVASNIGKASILPMYARANYVKTSTGEGKVAATPEAAHVACQAIKEYYDETGIQIGFRPASGINLVMDAPIYYITAKEVLGEKWLTNKWFRLGTNRLASMLFSEIEGKEVKFF